MLTFYICFAAAWNSAFCFIFSTADWCPVLQRTVAELHVSRSDFWFYHWTFATDCSECLILCRLALLPVLETLRISQLRNKHLYLVILHHKVIGQREKEETLTYITQTVKLKMQRRKQHPTHKIQMWRKTRICVSVIQQMMVNMIVSNRACQFV